MAQSELGKDGKYRMIIEDRYKKLAGVRRDAKLMAVLGGLYGFTKVGLASIPAVVYGEEVDYAYTASVVAILLAFVLFNLASGGGKPHKENSLLLWLFAIVAAIIGSKALLDAWKNPVARAMLFMPAAQSASPYDQAVAKLMVQKLSIDPGTAIHDIDIINLVLDSGGMLAFLAAAAATFKYLQLKRQPVKPKFAKKAA